MKPTWAPIEGCWHVRMTLEQAARSLANKQPVPVKDRVGRETLQQVTGFVYGSAYNGMVVCTVEGHRGR